MSQAQKGILSPVPPLARYLSFTSAPGINPAGALRMLCKLAEGEKTIMIGTEDGIVDALFTFTRPISGSYF